MNLLAMLALLSMMSCSGYKYNDDNVVEEGAEFFLKQETGLDIDFTPSDPETGFSPKSLKPVEKVEKPSTQKTV